MRKAILSSAARGKMKAQRRFAGRRRKAKTRFFLQSPQPSRTTSAEKGFFSLCAEAVPECCVVVVVCVCRGGSRFSLWVVVGGLGEEIRLSDNNETARLRSSVNGDCLHVVVWMPRVEKTVS